MMKPHRLAHLFFLLTILAKGMLGVVQLATAASIVLGITSLLPSLVQSLVAVELAEDPNDFVAARLLSFVGRLPETDTTFYALYFAAHGLLHVAVVAALLFSAAWAYPFTIIVLCAFVVYQVVEWTAVGGPLLIALSAIDLLVIYLTRLEWRNRPDPH